MTVNSSPRRTVASAANRAAATAGVLGLISGGASSETATWPSTALWTSRFVCGGPNQLTVDTSNYSYKAGQSGTSVEFRCLTAEGAHSASWFMITSLQAVWIAVLVLGALTMGVVIRRRLRLQQSGRRVRVSGRPW